MRLSRLARGLAVAAVLALVAAACSGGDPVAVVEPSPDDRFSLAFDDGSAEESDGDGDEIDEPVEVDERNQDHLFRVLEALQSTDAGSAADQTTSTTLAEDDDMTPQGGAP